MPSEINEGSLLLIPWTLKELKKEYSLPTNLITQMKWTNFLINRSYQNSLKEKWITRINYFLKKMNK